MGRANIEGKIWQVAVWVRARLRRGVRIPWYSIAINPPGAWINCHHFGYAALNYSRSRFTPDLTGEIKCNDKLYYIRVWKHEKKKEGLPYAQLWMTFWPMEDRNTERLRMKDAFEQMRMADFTQRRAWLLGEIDHDPEKDAQEERKVIRRLSYAVPRKY